MYKSEFRLCMCKSEIRPDVFDLNHDLNHSKKLLIYDFFFIRFFLIADLYEFNTINCLQASSQQKKIYV